MTGTKKILTLALLLGTSIGGSAFGQDWRPGPPPMERAFQSRHGRWWDDSKVAQQIGLTPDQQKKMDDIFQAHRLKLIDLNANLQKQEALMEPLMSAEQPEEGKILSQIDAIAQARAELEKANARMLLGIRQVLTPDQWKKLKAMREQEPHPWMRDGMRDRMRDGRGPGGPGGPPPSSGPGNAPPAPQQ